MQTVKPSAIEIDAVLPQTQCGLCGFKGCMPYATALAEGRAAINLCPPGGVAGLLTLAAMLNENPEPFIADMELNSKPTLVALIREAECIGCTKCIQACPVDAILGGAKQMHTVIKAECTGCELCIAPCPVDCIDLIQINQHEHDAEHFRQRFNARENRLQKKKEAAEKVPVVLNKEQLKKNYIQAALLRNNAKRTK